MTFHYFLNVTRVVGCLQFISCMEASVDTNSLSLLHLTPHSRRYGHIKDLLAYLVITTASLIPGLR